ncbi:hypothetical protein G9A89_011961 [Geosiphon pyriformis]|nr:hypothetical protein G9A89_011961 [Geosiphon pyriformis]
MKHISLLFTISRGVAQKYLFRCRWCRRDFGKKLALRYVSKSGIPLVQKVRDYPPDFTPEGRIQILESILEEYYIETYYLERLRQTKLFYTKQAEFEQRIIDDDDDDDDDDSIRRILFKCIYQHDDQRYSYL